MASRPYSCTTNQPLLSHVSRRSFSVGGKIAKIAKETNQPFTGRTWYEESSAAAEFIEEFEEDTFWDEPAARLAERDLVREVGGVEKLSKLSVEERVKKGFILE